MCIGAIEKFINEYALAHGAGQIPIAPPNGKRVAVVGAGPGGLACADVLSQLGYSVTVFESQMLPGGLLLFGIPAFKLGKARGAHLRFKRSDVDAWLERNLVPR